MRKTRNHLYGSLFFIILDGKILCNSVAINNDCRMENIMKKRLKGLLALIMVMAMIVSISPYTFGAIGDGVWGSAPDSEKFMKVVIDAEMTLEERLEEAYESTGWYLLQTYEVDVDDNASIGTSMDNYSEYAPDHYRIDGWKIWECYYSGELCLDDELKTTLVGADYIVTEEDIKQYGQTDGWFLYQPYIEAKFAPIDYVFPVYDVTGTQILEDLSFNIKNYKDKTLDIPEGYAGYMMTIQVENINGVFQYESFVHSYETMFNELDYYVKGYGASEISIAKIVPTKKMPYYVEDIEKIENLKILGSKKTIWLEPGESLVDNEELMTYYPYHMPEGEWEVWFVNSSGYLYEYKDEEVGVTITDAFTAEGYSEFMNYPKKYYNSTYPILREKLTPRIYEIPVYDMKGIKTEETFDINIDNYKKWDDNIGEDSTTTLTYDFNNHLTTEGDYWIFEYGDTSVTVENPSQIGNILFAEKTTCDMSKAKLKAVCNEHKYDKGVVVNDSTLSKLGTTKYTCTKCGDSYTKDDIPKKIAVRTVTIPKDIYTYTGANIEPAITVTARINGVATPLNPKTDYTVVYKNSKNPGVATVIVTGKGKFTGTITTTFTIKPNWIKKVKQIVEHTYTKNLRITWDKIAGINGYEVYMSDAEDGEFVKVGNVAASSNQYISKELNPGTRYYYKVRAYKVVGDKVIYGNFSNVTMAVTRPLTTKGVRYNRNTSKLTWWVSKGSAGYEIYHTTNRKFLGSKLGETTYANRSLDVSSLKKGKTYYIRVRSYVKTATGKKIYGAFSSQFKFKR